METEIKLKLAFRYLEILQEGRIKPDKKGGEQGIIRDSLDNITDIRNLKKFINKTLGVVNE